MNRQIEARHFESEVGYYNVNKLHSHCQKSGPEKTACILSYLPE